MLPRNQIHFCPPSKHIKEKVQATPTRHVGHDMVGEHASLVQRVGLSNHEEKERHNVSMVKLHQDVVLALAENGLFDGEGDPSIVTFVNLAVATFADQGRLIRKWVDIVFAHDRRYGLDEDMGGGGGSVSRMNATGKNIHNVSQAFLIATHAHYSTNYLTVPLQLGM